MAKIPEDARDAANFACGYLAGISAFMREIADDYPQHAKHLRQVADMALELSGRLAGALGVTPP